MRSRSRGFSLIEVMVATGILGVIGYFVASLFQTSMKNATQSNVSVQADVFKRNLVNNLANDAAWANTVAKNPGLSCLANLFTTPPGVASCPNDTVVTNFVVQNAGPGGGATVYDPSSPQNGFSSTGAPCATFSVAGNDKCPFRMDLTATLSCPSGATCSLPQVRIVGTVTYAPSNQSFKVALNAKKYGFDFIRGQNGTDVVGSGNAGYLPIWDGPSGTPSSQLGNSEVFQDDTGKIGVGTTTPLAVFDVAGSIRPGSSGVAASQPCSPEGAFAYDKAAHVPVFCGNAAIWQPLGGGGSSAVWTTVGSWSGPGTQFFNVNFAPKNAGSWVNVRVDIPVVGGQGGLAELDLSVDGTVVAKSFRQFANVAGHSGPMTLTYWFQPASTNAVNIKVSMSGSNGLVNQAPISVPQSLAVVLAVTENSVH